MRDTYKTINMQPSLDRRSTTADPVLDAKKVSENIEGLQKWVLNATRAREVDLQDYNNQKSQNPVFYNYIPASSSDLLGTEKAGDMAADTSHLYIVVNNSGTLEWQRVAISTF